MNIDLFRFVRAAWRNSLAVVVGICCVTLALMVGRLFDYGGLLPHLLVSLVLLGAAAWRWGDGGFMTGPRIVTASAAIVILLLGFSLLQTLWGLLPPESTEPVFAVWEKLLPFLVPLALFWVIAGLIAYFGKKWSFMKLAGLVTVLAVLWAAGAFVALARFVKPIEAKGAPAAKSTKCADPEIFHVKMQGEQTPVRVAVGNDPRNMVGPGDRFWHYGDKVETRFLGRYSHWNGRTHVRVQSDGIRRPLMPLEDQMVGVIDYFGPQGTEVMIHVCR